MDVVHFNHHDPIQWFLYILIRFFHYKYDEAVVAKDILATLGSIVLGALLMLLMQALLYKDTRSNVVENSNSITISSVKKGKRRFIRTTMSKETYQNLSVIMLLNLLVKCMFVRIFPIKQLHVVDNRSTRITSTVVVALFIIICIVIVLFDVNSLMQIPGDGIQIQQKYK